jgi:hypothetical protein
MGVTNTIRKQVDLPVWEWMRFSPVTTSSLTALTTARDGSDRYLYYFGSNVLYRYDTWGDSWQQLSTGVTPITTLAVRYLKSRGFGGNILENINSTSFRIPSTGGNNINGLRIKIVSGPGQGQERTIISTSSEFIHDSGLVTTATASVLTDSTKKWRFNQWEGYSVRLIFNTGFSQFREIMYNDTTSVTVFDSNYEGRNFLMSPFSSLAPYATPVATAGSQANFSIVSQIITIDSPWDIQPTNASKFMILSGGIFWLSQNASTPFFNFYYYDILSDRWVQKLTPTNIFSTAISTDYALIALSDKFGHLFGSTATSATIITLSDTGQTMSNGNYVNNYIQITGGTGSGQERRIISNTSNKFIFDKEWDILPDNTSKYSVTQSDNIYVVGNARAQMFKYSPELSLWSTGNISDYGITLNMALLKTNEQHHGISTANRVTNGITAINTTPTSGGSGYVINDLLTVTTGGSLGRVIVESVNSFGAVLSVSLYTAGSGYSVGTGRATSGGAGAGCTIEITSVGTIGVVTTAINHDIMIGDSVTFSGATETAWNTVYSILGIQSATIVELSITATANAVPTFTLATNLLVDVSKNWILNEHTGKIIGVQSNGLTGALTWRKIIGNSNNTISFLAGTAPTNGNSKYYIQDLDAFGVDVAYMADAELSYGYATSGTTGVFVDTGKTFTVSAYTNNKITLIDTSGNTSEDIVTMNTTNTLSIGRTVAGGQSTGGNTLAYSNNNGLTWIGLGTSLFANHCYGIAWSGTRFVGVGTGTNSIAWSNDGITWNGLGASIFTSQANGIAWNGTRFVAVGSGTNSIAWSNDGITWNGLGTTIFTTAGNGVAWNGTRWIAVGQGTNSIAWSNDGITWNGLGTTIFTTAGNGVASNGSRIVVVGQGTNTIAYSDDNGLTYTNLGTTIFTTAGNGVAWNGTRWIAVGQGTNSIAWSNDGITWNGLGATIFTTAGFAIGWNGTRWIAGGSGTNTLAYSDDNGLTFTGLGTSLNTVRMSTISSTTPFLSMIPNIGVLPIENTRYKIHDTYGSVTAGSTTTLTDNNKRWKTNQWAGKRLQITSGTGVQQELTIASNTATQLTFATATAPDTTSTYSILGRPAIGAGISIEWNWGMNGDFNNKGRYLVSPRGGGSHTFDIYDIRTNRWIYGDFIFGQGETLTTGSMYAYDGCDRIYFTKDGTGRINYYDINKKSIEPFSTIPYGMSTAILANRMEIITTDDGLQYLYIMRHTGTEMFRCLIQN